MRKHAHLEENQLEVLYKPDVLPLMTNTSTCILEGHITQKNFFCIDSLIRIKTLSFVNTLIAAIIISALSSLVTLFKNLFFSLSFLQPQTSSTSISTLKSALFKSKFYQSMELGESTL